MSTENKRWLGAEVIRLKQERSENVRINKNTETIFWMCLKTKRATTVAQLCPYAQEFNNSKSSVDFSVLGHFYSYEWKFSSTILKNILFL